MTTLPFQEIAIQKLPVTAFALQIFEIEAMLKRILNYYT